MKKIIFGLLVVSSISSFASEKTIECKFVSGGYDDETITAVVNGKTVESMTYVSFQGEVGPFVKLNKNMFSFTTSELVLVDTVRFSKNLSTAKLKTTYKKTGMSHSSKTFICK